MLKTRRFMPLFICQSFAALGDNLLRTAFVTLVTYYATELSDTTSSIIVTLSLALFTLPFCLFSALAGQLADKYDKAILIRYIKLFNILITGVAIVGFQQRNYYILLLSIFLTGIQSALFGPVKYSILPDHLPREDILIANGLIEASTFIAILVGTVGGGIIISNTELDVMITNGVLIAITLGMILTSFLIPNTKPADPNLKINFNPLTETIRSIKQSQKHEELFLAILGISWFWLIGGVFIAQMPSLTKHVFYANEKVFTLLLTLFSIGTGLGSIFCNRLLKSEITLKYVPTAMILMSVFLFDIWYTSTLFYPRTHLGGLTYFLSSFKGLRVSIDAFLIAFCGGIYIVPLYSYLQVQSKGNQRSRAIAANNIVNSLFMVIASLSATLLLAIGLTVSNLLLIIAIANFFTAVYVCRILPDTVIKNFIMMLFKLLYRVEINGIENYHKAKGRVLIVANHSSFLDPLLIGTVLPERLCFAIDTYIARAWWLKPFLRFLKAYPVDPNNPMAAKTLIDKLKKKQKVVIFPEGRITVTGSLMKVYEGPGLIADKADAVLLPIRLDGPQYSIFSRMRGKMRIRAFPKFKMTILPPQKIEVPKSITGRERRHLIGYRLYDVMSNMIFEGSKTQNTIFQALVDARKLYGGRKHIIDDIDHNRLSYNKLLIGSFVLGNKISKITADEKIGLMLPNASGTLVTLFSLLSISKIPVMINFTMGASVILSCCHTAEVKTVLTSRKFIERANLYEVVEELEGGGLNIVYLEDVRNKVNILDKLIGVWKSKFARHYYLKESEEKQGKTPSAEDPAVVLFTSGSEGNPKGVVLSHQNIQFNLKQFTSRADFNSSDKVFNVLPMFHSFGLTAGTMLPLLFGMQVFFYPSPLHYRVIPEMVYGTSSTILLGTDTFLAGYAKYAHPYDFFSMRYVVCGAEKLKEKTAQMWMEKFGIRIFEGYGATEASPVISVNTPMHFKAGTVGRILPGIKYKLEKVDGIEEGGELIISGPNVMLGYMKQDRPGEIQPPTYKSGDKVLKNWYDTGDIVKVDLENYVTILGRAKRFAKIAGEMISLAYVEEIVKQVWPEFNHAAISVDSERKGEEILLITDNPQASKDQLIEFCRENKIAEIMIPSQIHIVEQIPLLGSGKTDYAEINRQYKA